METSVTSPRVVAGITTTLLVLSLIGTGINYKKKELFKDQLTVEKELTKKLSSEKESLQKEIADFQKELAQMKGNNDKLHGTVEDMTAKLDSKQSQLTKMGKETTNLRKQLGELQVIRDELKKDREEAKALNNRLEEENKKLLQANAGLKSEILDLKEKLKTSAVKVNKFRVELTRKKKDKLTVSAKKTHVLTVSFEHNLAALAFMGEQKVFLVVKSQNGSVLSADNSGKASLMLDGIQKEIQYSAVQPCNAGNENKAMTFRMEPEEDLVAGVYDIDVYTEHAYLGSSQFRLIK